MPSLKKTLPLSLVSAVVFLCGAATSLAQLTSGTFTVQNGAFPWYDRVNVWALDSVPDTLAGGPPLPQQSCGSRSLELPGTPKTIVIGVSQNDVASFKLKYPAVQDTAYTVAVKNTSGNSIPYEVMTFPNPPQKIPFSGGAGLLLLRVDGAALPAPSGTPQASPAASAPKQAFETGPKEKLHLYLLFGQSNMVGRDTTGIDSQTTDPRIGYLDGGNQWIVAQEPMHAGGSGFGPGIFFAREMLKRDPDIKIGLIPCAVGGTPLSRWVKGADLYENAVKRTKTAMEAGVLKGALWHQGESDTTKAENASTYETRLTGMFKDLRTDLGTPELPIVAGQLGQFIPPNANLTMVCAAIKHMPADLPHIGFADSNGLKDKGDRLHFSAAAQKEFGARYAAAMIQLQNGAATASTQP